MSYPVSFYACKKILKIEKENKNINSRFTRICKTSTVKNIVNRNFTFVTAWKNTKKVSGWLLSYFLLADCRFTSYWLITVLLLIGWLLSLSILNFSCNKNNRMRMCFKAKYLRHRSFEQESNYRFRIIYLQSMCMQA